MNDENYQTIGTLLRTAREDLRLSPEQVSRELHIRVRYVRALEEGNLKELPGLTYTKGYLQAYTMFLGLDRDEIFRRFEQIEEQLARKGFYFPHVISREKSPAPVFIWGSIALAMAAYAGWALLQPSPARISVVERFPEKFPIIAVNPKDVACFGTQNSYYPPCTMARERLNFLPLRRENSSVMELVHPQTTDK